MAKRLRAVFYARVSTDEEKQLNALEKQLQENRDVIKEQGWTLVGEYIDEGKTGTTVKRRNDYQRLLEDMTEDKFDIIVVKDQDRLQRNTRDWYLFVDRLITNNIQLYFYLDKKFFTPNEDGLITGIKAILAEEYSRNLSKKLNNANRRRIEKAKAGEEVSAMGNGKSLGFAIKDGKWVQVPEEIELAKKIFELYLEMDSIRKVRDWLNSHGYRNSVGNQFTTESVVRVLRNEKAKGVIVMGQYHHDFNLKKIIQRPEEEWVRVPAPELAYVSEEMFEAVQSRLKAKTGKKRGKRKGADPLSGKIFCAKCGSPYWRHMSNGYYNWYCGNKYSKGDTVCTGSGATTTVKIRKVYAELMDDLVIDRKAVKSTLVEWLEKLKNRLLDDSHNESTLKELERLNKRKNKLTEAYMDEIISKEDYKVKYKELEETIEKLEISLTPVEENEDVKEIEAVLQNIDAEIEECLKNGGFENSKIDFLIEHTKRITVNEEHLIVELDLLAGAIIAGESFLLFVHDTMQFCVQTENYIVEIRLAR